MRDLRIVDYAAFAPGTCMVCGTHEGPFLDTGVDIVGDGRMYLCVRTCLRIAAEKALFLPSPNSPIISFEDAVERPEEVYKSLFPERCSAEKKNGERCNGKALPGRPTCVAHSRGRKTDPSPVSA